MTITQDLYTIEKSLHHSYLAAPAALARVRAFVGSEILTRLQRVEEDLAKLKHDHDNHHGNINRALLGSLDAVPISVESLIDQEARCWSLIERWWEKTGRRSEALVVRFAGPFHQNCDGVFYYCQLPAPGTDRRGATRLDALAQAAQWCETELNS